MVRRYRQQMEEARTRTIWRTRIGLLAGGGAMLVGAAGLCLGGLGGLVGLLPSGSVAMLGVALLVGGIGAFLLATAVALRRPDELRKEGLPGRAKFLELTGGGLSINVDNASMRGNIAQFALKLEVHLDGRPPYEVVVKDFVPSSAIPQLVPGTWFGVFVDRRKPKRVLVDWPEDSLGQAATP